MKKAILPLIVLVLVLSLVYIIFAPKNKTGIVKNFTEKSITIVENNNTNTYKINSATKVTQSDTKVVLLDTAQKGMKVSFTASGKLVKELNLPGTGEAYEGEFSGNAIVATREMESESPEAPEPTATEAVKMEETGAILEDTAYGVYKGTVELGDVGLVPNTLEVTFKDKKLKVIDEKAEFDTANPEDEVRLVFDGLMYILEFEKTPDEFYLDEFQKVLSVKYQKKMYHVTITDTSKLIFSENVIANLNGSDAPFIRAMNRANFCSTIADANGEIVFFDGYYKDLDCMVDNINKDTMDFTAVRQDKELFKDTLKISEDVRIQDESGKAMALKDLMTKDHIKLSVDPSSGYKVISIEKIKQ